MGSRVHLHGTRLEGLKVAFTKFMEKRRRFQGQTSESDLISVASHETHCHEKVRNQLLARDYDAIQSAVASIPASGGNEFYNGLEWCYGCVRSTPAGYIPIVVFMADGGDCMNAGKAPNDKYTMVDSIVGVRPEVQLYSIMAFSTGASDIAVMSQIASRAGRQGHYHGTPDAEQLGNLFATIAGDSKPVENLVKAVAGHVRDAITQAISSRCY
jgi:hypothetical protein